MAPRTDITLDLDKVVKAAFDVLAKEGIEKLTMRRLAAELSVQPSALYWHFSDKAELLSMMGHTIYIRAIAGVPPASSWREWLLGFGAALHRILTSHRDAARVFALAHPAAASLSEVQPRALVEPVVALDVDEESALYFVSSVVCLAVGWSTFNDNPALQDMLGRMLDLEHSFGVGLAALVRGFPDRVCALELS